MLHPIDDPLCQLTNRYRFFIPTNQPPELGRGYRRSVDGGSVADWQSIGGSWIFCPTPRQKRAIYHCLAHLDQKASSGLKGKRKKSRLP